MHRKNDTEDSDTVVSRSVLVTGAGGFLGGAVARALIDAGHEVRSVSRGTYPHLAALGVKHSPIDLGARDAADRLAEVAEGCRAAFHVAALTGAWGPWLDYQRANVEGTRNVLEACARAGIRCLVHTSTPSVVFDGRDQLGVDETVPLSTEHHAWYTKSKALAERLVLEEAPRRGVRCVALRPHLVWGPGDTSLLPRIVDRARKGRLMRIMASDGPKQIAPTYIDDAVAAHLLAWSALERDPSISGRAYFVTSGEAVEPWAMIDDLLATQGLSPLRRRVGERTALMLAAFLEGLWTVTRRSSEPPLTRWVVRELTTSHTFDLDRARRELGFVPRWSIEQGLRQLASSSASDESPHGAEQEERETKSPQGVRDS